MPHKLERIPFKPEHAYQIELREREALLLDRLWLANAGAYAKIITYMWNGKILAIGGYYEKWKGVAKVFAVPGKCIEECPKSYVKAAKEAIEVIYNDFVYHRLETESLADAQTDKWMTILGFHAEGTLEKFSSNKLDFRMWARIK